jgi:beta-mannanase
MGFRSFDWGIDLTVEYSFASNAEGITHAAHLRPTLEYGDEIKDFNALVGKNIGLLMYFLDWTGVPPTAAFDTYLVNKIQQQITNPSERPVIMLTWQPMKQNNSYGCTQIYNGVIPPADIIAGNCDAYITQFALELKARSERFILRFAHEMNITDSPWWPGHFGADASQYVQMWQHVYDVFNLQGVSNVEWIWSPNYASNPVVSWNDVHNYYPGDSYLDWIGVSGFNWYDTRVPSVWRSFEDLFRDVLTDFACRYAKPQIITEIGSVEGGGAVPTKADWIIEAYNQAQNYPFLRAVTWFNDYAYANPSFPDFRVTTGTAQDGGVNPLPPGTNSWTNAYSSAISDSTYENTFPSLTDATPSVSVCNAPNQIYFPIGQK